MMGTSVAIFNRRVSGHFVKLTIFHYIPSDKNNNLLAYRTRVSQETTSQLKDKTMNKYGMIFGVVMFAVGFFTRSVFSPWADAPPSADAHAAMATSDKPIPAQTTLTNKPDAEKLALKKQIAQLEAQVTSLKQHKATHIEASKTATPGAVKQDADADSTEPQMVSIELEELRKLVAAKAIREAEERGDFRPTFDINPDSSVADVKKNFSEENIDYSWATPQETKLYDTFSSTEKLAELSITQTVCKTSVCLVSVSVDANEPFDSESLIKAVSGSGANAGFRTLMVLHQIEAGLVDIYFSK